ncbi:hypothetical protein [Zavarzinella formosa]|uniref:hypothetical protein n=1 Tax=Zavarzinella formosa TaxID=360055 RepID=UPI00031C175B|nr:hypothetical protein [Zavarzinella formosa]
MSSAWTKADLPFLAKAMDHKHHVGGKPRLEREAAAAPATGSGDKVNGDISIPQPLTVDVNGTMTPADYKACAMVMAVCQNMVQKSITDAAKVAGIEAADALKNMNAWVQGYVDFPFPFFNFKDTQSDVYYKADFSLTADPDVVESIINIKGVQGLKDAVVGALKKSGGNLASYEGTDRKFNYFGVITAYNETEIAMRVIKYQMNLKTTVVDSLCVHYSQTNLDTAYDTYQFVADKDLMIKMQAKMGDQLIDYMATKLLAFVEAFYDKELGNYQKNLADLLKGGSS